MQQQIEALKRCNFPFYFIKPEEISKLRKIGLESQEINQKKIVIKQLLDYEALMRQFKIENPNMFKRKETFGVTGINIDVNKQPISNDPIDSDVSRKPVKKKKKSTMFSFNSEQQKRNTEKLKKYIQHLESI